VALIPIGGVALAADIVVPEGATGVVLFAHGSGSSRHSPRNRFVAEILQRGSMATILADLLTAEEERIDSETAELRFDIPLLARRLTGIADWANRQPILGNLSLGCFGASTGAAAALVTAAERPSIVQAVVSRGGRPDLAATALRNVRAPSLFIVGGEDREVLSLNEWALARLPSQTERRLEIVPGATHLFEEPGALDRVATLARDWFQTRLS
jgi:pimeloyl-ACP methyl ester carboxylesterase